ncbi:hypothetical protein PQX77_002900 [Marasmius sp. AFHP31]|nr:hypothetical protein PQX77_002900 [Marasmius sp. AFHP31]
MPHQHQETGEDTGNLNHFADHLSLRHPLHDIRDYRKWFRSTRTCQHALLRLFIEVAPKVLDKIACPENPRRAHVVHVVLDGNVKLKKVTRARCECGPTLLELSAENSKKVIDGFNRWNDAYEELHRFLENQRQSVTARNRRRAEAKVARITTGGLAPMPERLQRWP